MIERFGAEGSGAGGQRLPFVPAVRAGDFVFVSGQVAMGEDGEIVGGGIIAQTRKTIENLKRALALAGCDLGDVVKVNVWLDDPRDFWSFNRVYGEYFSDAPPARSTVASAIMVDARIEMDVIAYRPG